MRGSRSARTVITSSFVLAVAGALPAIAAEPAQPDRRATEVTYSGCVVDEPAFARLTGLAAAAGTSGANAGLVLVLEGGSAIPQSSYVLIGTRERELAGHVGRRVEATGRIESPAPTSSPASGVPPDVPLPAGATGVTPQGSPAHEPGDAARPLPAPVGTDATVATAEPRQPIGLGDLPRLNVVSFRVVEGSCSLSIATGEPDGTDVPAIDAAAGAPVAAAGGRPRDRAPRALPGGIVTVIGCVMLEPPATGRIPDPGRRESDSILLTRAAILGEDGGARARSAVPGSLPSGRGSGTVPEREVARSSQNASSDVSLSFALEGASTALAALVGRGVEIVGTFRDLPRATGAAPSAHSTQPVATLAVESVKPVDRACR